MDWIQAITTVLSPDVLIYACLGVFIGLFIGTLPGLSSTMAIAILTPLTFWLEPTQGFAMLIGVYNSAIFSGGISAIVINTPGTPASIASTFDGYAMTQRGQAGLGLGINTIYSVLGGILSTVVLMAAAFPLARFALKFGPAEFFLLTLFGLMMMVSVSQGSVLKGLLLGFFGMLLSTVGLDPMLSNQRFTGGSIYLMDGISFIPVMIGLFGFGEMLFQIFTTPRDSNGKTEKNTVEAEGRIFPTMQEARKMGLPAMVSAVIGIVIGAIPGAGGDIASIVSWDVCKRMSKQPEQFGKGSIEGLAGTCTANNASIGGALTTALTLGVPGDSNTAVLLGSLMMYGMLPGPQLFTKNADFVRNLMVLMVVANLLILVFGLLTAKVSVKILSIPKEAIWVAVILLSVIGAYALNRRVFDVIIMFAFGLVGFVFRKMEFPLGPMILGLLLGKLCESNMRRALALSAGEYGIFFGSPIALVLVVLILLVLASPMLQPLLKKCKAEKKSSAK